MIAVTLAALGSVGATLVTPASAAASGGTVVGWGSFGTGPAAVPAGLSGVTSVAAGARHSLALRSDGSVVAWGVNDSHQLDVPAGLARVAAISAGGDHSLALLAEGTVVTWGGGPAVPAGLSGVTAVAAGFYHDLALKSDGTVVAWGDDYLGRAEVPAGLDHVTAIAAGISHNLALLADGTVVGWGYNAYGQATPPAGLSGVTAIAAAGAHSLALKSDGTVVAWGDDSAHQSQVPDGLKDVVAISAGDDDSVAVRSDGTVVAWGGNSYGPSEVPAGLNGVVAVAAGINHTLAVVVDRTAPSASPSVSPAANAAGWRTSDATVTWNWADNAYGRGVDTTSCAATSTSSGEGALTVTGTCADLAGNVGRASALVKVDTTAPALSISGGPADGGSYPLGSVPAAPSCSATDTVSGVDANGCVVSGYSTAAGRHTVTFTATDVAGNVTTASRTYTVVAIAPTIAGSAPTTVTAGSAYSFAYTATGTPAATVSLASGSLPSGITLSPDGKLTGTPTAAGTSTFTVQAANGVGSPAISSPQSITVTAAAAAVVSVNGGDARSETAGQPFATPLSVLVKDSYGNPVPNTSVTFTVTSGSATFAGKTTATAVTNDSGIATAATLTAGKTAGPVTVTAALTGTASVPAVSFTETVISVTSARADLKVTVTAPTTAPRGGTFTITVRVTNAGPNAAGALAATLNLGCNLRVTNTGGGTAGLGNGSVRWSATGLASGASLTYTVTVKANPFPVSYTSPVTAAALSVVPDPALTSNLTQSTVKLT